MPSFELDEDLVLPARGVGDHLALQELGEDSLHVLVGHSQVLHRPRRELVDLHAAGP